METQPCKIKIKNVLSNGQEMEEVENTVNKDKALGCVSKSLPCISPYDLYLSRLKTEILSTRLVSNKSWLFINGTMCLS